MEGCHTGIFRLEDLPVPGGTHIELTAIHSTVMG